MTHSALHELLDSKKPLTLAKVEKAVEEMKHDVENKNYRLDRLVRKLGSRLSAKETERIKREISYYDGEANAFYIVLQLIGKKEKE